MDIYEECKQETNKSSSNKVKTLLEKLNKKDAESLKRALLDPAISTRTIARVLESNKIDCGVWALNTWRRQNGVERVSTHSLVKENK
jgi:hypothetical protein